MNFGEAISAMKAGKKVRRKEWSALGTAPNGFNFMFYVEAANGFQPFIGAETNNGEHHVGNITHGAMLADDWFVIE